MRRFTLVLSEQAFELSKIFRKNNMEYGGDPGSNPGGGINLFCEQNREKKKRKDCGI